MQKYKRLSKIAALTFVFVLVFECFTSTGSFIQNNCLGAKTSPFYYIINADEFVLKGIKALGELLVKAGTPENYAKAVSANFRVVPEEVPKAPAITPEKEPAQAPPETEQPVEKTIAATAGNVNVNHTVTIKNQTSYPVDAKGLTESGIPFSLKETSEPQVLIIHTHGTESYTPSEKYTFSYTTNSRTTDPNYNVVRIGKELSDELKGMGIGVIHDVTMYDYPDYNSSYDKAYYGIQAMLRKYPSVQLVLDIHRDAVNTETGETVKLVGDVKGEKAAQIMFVVGTDECGFSHPNWEHNLKFAAMLQSELYGISPSLVRPINLRTSRFNQHFTKGSLIVEVGTNGNTLDEALVSAKHLAQAVKNTMNSLK